MNKKAQTMAQLRAALQMFAASLSDTSAMEVSEIYPKWVVGKAYKVDDICGYGLNGVGDTQLYRVLQAHTSQADWTPDTALSLFKAIGKSPSGYDEWSQPVGATDAYEAGDIVSHNDKLWQSDIDGNVWEPGVYGWSEYSD